MIMIHEGPYTNLHDLNIDWILQVVKEFQDKYNDVDGYFQGLITQLNTLYTNLSNSLTELYNTQSEELQEQALGYIAQMQTALTAAITDIGTAKDTAISDLNAAYTQAVNGLEVLKNQIIASGQSAVTNINTAKTNALNDITSERGTALQQVETAKNAALSELQALPPYVVDSASLVKSVLFQTRTYPAIKQGAYNASGEYGSDTTHVCTDIIHSPIGANVTILVSGNNNSLYKICYWYENGTYNETSVPYITQEYNINNIASPVKDIAFVFTNSADASTAITPADITVEFVWTAPLLEGLVSVQKKQAFSVTEKLQARENISAAHIDMMCYAYRQTVTDNWERGVYSSRNGSKITSSIYIRHDVFIGIRTGHARIICDSAYEMLLYAWDYSNTYQGNLKTDFTFTTAETGYLWVQDFDFSLFPDYIIKIGLRRKDLAQPALAEGLNVLFYLYTDTTMTELHKAADAAAVGSLIQALDTRVTALEQAAGINRTLAPLEQQSTNTERQAFLETVIKDSEEKNISSTDENGDLTE